MNGAYLGIDTSNYRTSVAAFSPGRGLLLHRRLLLPVAKGQQGLRQSDAVFAHVKQLPALMEPLLADAREAGITTFAGVAVSDRPRDAEGSYMPCFVAGESFARVLAGAYGAPLARVSHQTGHLLAALWSAGCPEWRSSPFLAFHVSGGTTEALLVRPNAARVLAAECVGTSLDLKAGQAIDRVGVMLGLDFPAGPQLETLADGSAREFRVRPFFRGVDCSFSGVENQARRMLDDGEPPCDVARYALTYVEAALTGMTERVLAAYGGLPLLYAGGVMANARLRETLGTRFGARFANPELSGDNACGVAVAGALQAGEAL